jgi:hypothetical protein
MRPPLAAEAGFGLKNKKEEIIEEITRKEKILFLLKKLMRVNWNTYFTEVN